MSAIEGKILTVTIGGKKLDCQTDGTLNITKEVTTDEPCKDSTGKWTTGRVTSKSWNISVSARTFLENVATLNQLDIIDLMIDDNDAPVEIEWLSTPGDHDGDLDVVLSGEAIPNNFTWNAPANDLSTQDIEFTGTGPLTKVEIPVTT